MNTMEDDFLFAHQLQMQLEEDENNDPIEIIPTKSVNSKMSLVDEFWELTDPNPDLHSLFLQFDKDFFWNELHAVEVKWSSRMTLCAGVCGYEGMGGLCSVRLSLPLLKLRPRKDLIETLLHEMIHAYLFVTHNNKDHNDHGAEFHKHMYRINAAAGTKISVYHSFHDEVDNYRQHWWRCTGPCQGFKPFYGYVRRAMNRAPSPRDPWWQDHASKCNGQFVKIKEPENYKAKSKDASKKSKVPGSSITQESSKGDIRNFFNAGTSSSTSSSSTSSFSGTGVKLGSSPSKLTKGTLKNHNSSTDIRTYLSNSSSSTSQSPSSSSISSSSFKPFIGNGNRLGSYLEDIKSSPVLSKKPPSNAHTKNKMGINSSTAGFKRKSPFDSALETKTQKVLPETADCPVCGEKVLQSSINSHLDSCLT